MAHKVPTTPSLENQDTFVPLDILDAPTPVYEPAPAIESVAESAPESVPEAVQEPVSGPDVAPVEADISADSVPDPAAAKGGRGRKLKAAKPASEKKPKSDKVPQTIYFEVETLQKVRVIHALTKRSISEVVTDPCEDMLHRSFECGNAGCNVKFTLSATSDTDAPKACYCPACGSNKVRTVKHGY